MIPAQWIKVKNQAAPAVRREARIGGDDARLAETFLFDW
jgi:hypothetical protein